MIQKPNIQFWEINKQTYYAMLNNIKNSLSVPKSNQLHFDPRLNISKNQQKMNQGKT